LAWRSRPGTEGSVSAEHCSTKLSRGVRAAALSKINCQAWPHNGAALALYRSRGFLIEGRLRRHWRRRNEQLWDAIMMGLVLDEHSPGSELADADVVR
jgi:ribosomal protein S18 acetylase RimI-like enzyme